jgi:hypothetical protein
VKFFTAAMCIISFIIIIIIICSSVFNGAAFAY